MKNSRQIVNDIGALEVRMQAILDQAEQACRELTETEKVEFDNSLSSIKTWKQDLVRAEEYEKIRAEELREKYGDLPTFRDDPLATWERPVKRPTSSSRFNGQDAKIVSNFVSGLMSGDHSMVRAAMSTFDNDLGGYLVPTPLSNLISELRQARGVARQECQIVPMTSASLALPKLASEVTASFIGESEELVESDPTLAQVMLQAKKLGVLVAMSSEVADDAVLTIVEMLARSTAYAFASKEDDCLFNGDSTSTYGHINGLKSALAAGSKVTATGQSSFGALTLAQFESVVGRCKRWATAEDPKWYFSRPGYFASASRLVNAAGGNSNNDLANGANEQTFLGYPVRFSDAIHSNLGASSGQVACYFGDLRSGVYMGDRKRIAIAADGSTRFSRDQILFRGLERFDINVHDTGTSTEAGGIVSLVFG